MSDEPPQPAPQAARRTVAYSADALKALKKHGNVAARIRRAVDEHAADSAAHANTVTQLVGSTAYRLKVGDYRAIFERTETEITVTKIAPRGSAYD